MTGTRILIGQIVVVFAIVFFTLWIATQWTAAAFDHQSALGAPWFEVAGRSVYKPWRLFQWWYAYEAYTPEIFARGGFITLSGTGLGIVAAIIGSVLRSRHERNMSGLPLPCKYGRLKEAVNGSSRAIH